MRDQLLSLLATAALCLAGACRVQDEPGDERARGVTPTPAAAAASAAGEPRLELYPTGARAAAGTGTAKAGEPPRFPWRIGPRYNDRHVATDRQLFAVLDRMKPPTGVPDTNNIVHALRLWGPAARFQDPALFSGAQMRRYFLDEAAFRRWAGSGAPPLFSISPEGVHVRMREQDGGYRRTAAVHLDDVLATLAEIGTPLDQPLKTTSGQADVRALLADAMRRFRISTTAATLSEWTLISYARYLFPDRQWDTESSRTVELEPIIDAFIDMPLPRGGCGGTHRLEALTVLYRADEQAHALPARARKRILAYMTTVAALLVRTQHQRGYWTKGWPDASAARQRAPMRPGERILVTGHHLEWLALAPPEVQPPREHVVRAGQWLARTMTEADAATLARRYGPFSHAARALCLWRSVDPYQAWRSGREEFGGDK